MKKKVLFIKLKSLNIKILSLYLLFILKILKKLNFFFNLINLPKQVKKITLLKSPHVYKKAKEQFEFTRHNKIIILDSSAPIQILDLVCLNKPKGLKITIKFEG